MPNFAVKPRTPARFDGDFQVETVTGEAPLDQDREYFTALERTLSVLAERQARDAAAGYSGDVLASRTAARKTVAAELKRDADAFAAGQLPPEQAKSLAEAAAKKYVASSAFAIRSASQPRFQGDFTLLAENYRPTAAEQAYLNELTTALSEFGADEASDPGRGYSPGVLENRQRVRKVIAEGLQSEAEQFCKGEISAESASRNVLIFLGRYRAHRDRLTRRLFNVYEVKHGATKGKTEDDLIVELDILLLSGLPPPDDKPSPEKQEFYVELNKALTVINTVCRRMQERATKANDALEKARILRLQHEYMDKLSGIAKIGLENVYTPLAKLALAELKTEFVAQEAGRIKNSYVRWLGLWSGSAALSFLIVYILISIWPDWEVTRSYRPWWQLHQSFLLAAVGGAIGTWISFSVRRVQLSFEDLLMLEEDSLDPPIRVIFVAALTITACLLFWTSTINLEVGGLKTAPQDFKQSGSIALLIGIFAGLSERALATAISGRAAAFVQGIAGSR